MGVHIQPSLGYYTQVKTDMPDTKVEVTRGVFDPREYKNVDKDNWARKRRSDWMAVTGKIHYVRERTVASEEREVIEKKQIKDEQKREEEIEEKDVEPKKNDEENEVANEEVLVQDSEPIRQKMIEVELKPKTEFWPRKKKSDITSQRYI